MLEALQFIEVLVYAITSWRICLVALPAAALAAATIILFPDPRAGIVLGVGILVLGILGGRSWHKSAQERRQPRRR